MLLILPDKSKSEKFRLYSQPYRLARLSGTDSGNRVRCTIPVMFCPECRAEYRPGFTRCSDCGVDLVHELPEPDTRAQKPKRDWLSMLPTVRDAYRNGRKTVHWWALYKRQTGTWPWASIAIHFMNWVVILFGGGFLVWSTVAHHLSWWQFLGIYLVVSIPYGILENCAKRTVKLNYLRNGKRLAKLRR